MHAAARQRYYNRGSKAHWEAMKAEDDRFSENLVQCMFFLSALIGFPILGIFGFWFHAAIRPHCLGNTRSRRSCHNRPCQRLVTTCPLPLSPTTNALL